LQSLFVASLSPRLSDRNGAALSLSSLFFLDAPHSSLIVLLTYNDAVSANPVLSLWKFPSPPVLARFLSILLIFTPCFYGVYLWYHPKNLYRRKFWGTLITENSLISVLEFD
jgi:hypothetical protein